MQTYNLLPLLSYFSSISYRTFFYYHPSSQSLARNRNHNHNHSHAYNSPNLQLSKLVTFFLPFQLRNPAKPHRQVHQHPPGAFLQRASSTSIWNCLRHRFKREAPNTGAARSKPPNQEPFWLRGEKPGIISIVNIVTIVDRPLLSPNTRHPSQVSYPGPCKWEPHRQACSKRDPNLERSTTSDSDYWFGSGQLRLFDSSSIRIPN
ncbi:hypothetical protein F5Y06DRAFT_155499 [Hypoxylon sp. FL0890]|nr:hypothetical protein F5Y06DRAFT_155499 [Hypoxylon sp. FL0890]